MFACFSGWSTVLGVVLVYILGLAGGGIEEHVLVTPLLFHAQCKVDSTYSIGVWPICDSKVVDQLGDVLLLMLR